MGGINHYLDVSQYLSVDHLINFTKISNDCL